MMRSGQTHKLENVLTATVNGSGPIISDGKLSADKLALSSEATWFRVFPGKPGYVMVTEYFRKKKAMEFRMEKLNYY